MPISLSLQNYLEIIASTSGIIGVYLTVRQNLWSWLFGMLTVTLHFFLFFKARLYAEMCLQVLYFVLQFYGLSQWLTKGQQNSLTISRIGSIQFLVIFLVGVLLFAVFTSVLQCCTDSTTIFIDSFVTALSVMAQWMTCKKYLESWWWWMLVNLVSVHLYFTKSLYLTSLLFFTFFILCIFGVRQWSQSCEVELMEVEEGKYQLKS